MSLLCIIISPIRCIHQSKPIELFLVTKLDQARDFPDGSIADVCGTTLVAW